MMNPHIDRLIFGIENKFVFRAHDGGIYIVHVLPMFLRFGTSQHYPDAQWLLEGLDIARREIKVYALNDISIDISSTGREVYANYRETKSEPTTDRPKQD